MTNQNPEQIARDNIDKQLIDSGWIIQSIKQVNLYAGLGVAVKEYVTDVGPADYALFVEEKPCGVIEGKREPWASFIIALFECVREVTFSKKNSINNLSIIKMNYESKLLVGQ